MTSVDDEAATSLVRRVGESALNLAARFGLITLISGLTTILITRLLHPSGYGVYGSAVATSSVLGAVADFGFSMTLSRDMAEDHELHRPLLRAAYEVSLSWSTILALMMVGLAFTAPITSQRGLALLVLAPSMVFNCLNPARVLFFVRYETRRILRVDLTVSVVQTACAVAVAAAGLGPIAVAAVVSIASVVSNVVVAVMADRMLPASAQRFSRRTLLRRSAPLGVMAVMTKVYLSIDLVLLGWYVAGPRLGDYAAAAKLLTVLAGLAGVIMSGVLPGLAVAARDRAQRNVLVGRVWQWLLLAGVPLFVALGLFAPLVVRVALGEEYRGAVALIRILAVAGVVTVLSNLVGNVMVAMRRVRQLFVQNTAAILLNIGANLILIPIYGVYAAAWITVATEVLVCTSGLVSLRRDLDLRALATKSARPAAAIALAAGAALPLLRIQAAALAVSVVVFLVALTMLGAWPPELDLRAIVSARKKRRPAGRP